MAISAAYFASSSDRAPWLGPLGIGQVRGLSKMVEEDRYCIDVVTQISAVRAALRRVEEQVLKDHVSHCVEHAIASGDKADQRQKIAELMAVVGRAER